jgi:hypothetical protein
VGLGDAEAFGLLVSVDVGLAVGEDVGRAVRVGVGVVVGAVVDPDVLAGTTGGGLTWYQVNRATRKIAVRIQVEIRTRCSRCSNRISRSRSGRPHRDWPAN